MSVLSFVLLMNAGCVAPHGDDPDAALLRRSTRDYWNSVYPPEIPRAFDVHRDGCPVCGDAIKKHGGYSWIIDPSRPFKVKCPECGTVFPDNDFEAYWKSGFKDRSLLTGKYVDDGRGWRPAEGKPKYWFVAYYNHWSMYQDIKIDGTDCYRLARGYRNTRDPAYARRSLAVLDHLADNYSRYDYSKQSRYAEEVWPDYTGRYVNSTWESIFTNLLADAYLWTRDFLDSEDEELSSVTGKTSTQMRRNIEDNLFRVVADDITSLNGRNSGNFGMHQKTLLKTARILNDQSLARWVTDFRPQGGVDLPLDYVFYNSMFSDGAPVESPGYNGHWEHNIYEMFTLLRENGIDEFARHKVSRHLFDYALKLVVCGRFSPSSGDSGMMSNSGFYARGRYGDNLTPDELVRLKERIGYESRLLPSYGFATLQNGNRKAPTALVLAFPSYYSHRHCDTLHIDLFAENAPLTPDFGYPDSASGDDDARAAFFTNTVSHNTVVVDCRRQGFAPSVLKRYDPCENGFAQYVSADGHAVYDGVSEYSRSLLVCETAPGKTIVFDVFRVKGGSRHDWFVHGCGESFSTDIPLTPQETGTLAGPDVKYATKGFGGYDGGGFHYLYDVMHGEAMSGQCVTLHADAGKAFSPNPGAALKVHMLGDGERISLSHGRPPLTQNNPQRHVAFLSRCRQGQAPLASSFATVLEPVSDLRAEHDVETVTRLDAGKGTEAAKLRLKDGKLLYVFISGDVADFQADSIRFRGQAGAVLLDKAAGQGRAYVAGPGEILCGGKSVVRAGDPFDAIVTDVLLEDECILLDRPAPKELAGGMFRVGDYAYRASDVSGNRVGLLEQSMLRGRGRLLEYSSDDHRSGRLLPAPSLARDGMALFVGDDKRTFVSRTTRLAGGNVTAEKDLELNIDYWISECAPGDRLCFPRCARAEFTLDE